MTSLEQYVLEVVMEFYANLPSKEEITDNKVYVRGKMYEFSAKLINSVLDLPESKRKVTWIDDDVDLNAIAARLEEDHHRGSYTYSSSVACYLLC